MTNLTQQIVLKISPELDELLNKAHEKSVQETGFPPTRSDYIRSVLKTHCDLELKEYKSIPNPYVKDSILNKVIWTLLCKIHLSTLPDQKPFRLLYLNDFIVGARTEVEEIFLFLKDRGIVELDKGNTGSLSLRLRTSEIKEVATHLYKIHLQELKNIALENIINSSEMSNFIASIKEWGKPNNSITIDDICLYSWHLPQAKTNLSNNGFIITKESNCFVEGFRRELITAGSPSEYARQLWELNLFDENASNKDRYITYPDIYINK
jgi:hypothetical protein